MSSKLIIFYFLGSSVRYQLLTVSLPRGMKVLKSHRLVAGCYSGDGEFWGWVVLTTGMLNSTWLALTKESLRHSMTFEMLGLMALLRACVTKCLSQVKTTV